MARSAQHLALRLTAHPLTQLDLLLDRGPSSLLYAVLISVFWQDLGCPGTGCVQPESEMNSVQGNPESVSWIGVQVEGGIHPQASEPS